MDKLRWIKDLVLSEQKMEESGEVDLDGAHESERYLFNETTEFLKDLKIAFVEAASAFNQLKGSSLGNVKIYGISRTEADFMLFRNGYKLIFALRQPGVVVARFHLIGRRYVPSPSSTDQNKSVDVNAEDLFYALPGAFGDFNWSFNEKPIRIEYLVRYYMSRFVRESTK